MENSIGILVVEDDGLIQSLVEETLTDGGYQVSTASTAERAIELLDVQEPKYRALVTDVQLGSEKLTGWDIARRAREITADLPIVYVTGDSGPEWASHGVPNSILVTKPIRSRAASHGRLAIDEPEYTVDGETCRIRTLLMMNVMPDMKLASASLTRIYDHPNCPVCGKQTSLARVEPAERGFDTRSFNCAKCGNELNLTVKLK